MKKKLILGLLSVIMVGAIGMNLMSLSDDPPRRGLNTTNQYYIV